MPKTFPFGDAWYRNDSKNKNGEPAPLDVGYCTFKPGQVRFLTARERHAANEPMEMALVNGRLAGPFDTEADATLNGRVDEMKAKAAADAAAEADRLTAEIIAAAEAEKLAAEAKAEAEKAAADAAEAARKLAEEAAEAEARKLAAEAEASAEASKTLDAVVDDAGKTLDAVVDVAVDSVKPLVDDKAGDDDWGDEAPKVESKPVSKPSNKKGK